MAPGLGEFLEQHPGMAIHPCATSGLQLRGTLSFHAHPPGMPEITDTYSLAITVPPAFPASLPAVIETAGQIPRDEDYHVNPDDTLCLGSPLRLLLKLAKQPTLLGYADGCIVPYLYAISHKLRFGGPFVFNELAHGTPGALVDYMDLFGVKQPAQARAIWTLLGMKERHANKKPCPCGCGQRLGRCVFRQRLREIRALASQAWFREHTL